MSTLEIKQQSEIARERALLVMAIGHLAPPERVAVLELICRHGPSAALEAIETIERDNPAAAYRVAAAGVGAFIGDRPPPWVEAHFPVAVAVGLLALDPDGDYAAAMKEIAIKRLQLKPEQVNKMFGAKVSSRNAPSLLGQLLQTSAENPGTTLGAGLLARAIAQSRWASRLPGWQGKLIGALGTVAAYYGLGNIAEQGATGALPPRSVEVIE